MTQFSFEWILSLNWLSQNRGQVQEHSLLTEFQRTDFGSAFYGPAHALAMMQHYGAPTTWLAFTRSPLVALYFALEMPDQKETMMDRQRVLHCLR
jgi:hypothetical protein